MMTSLRRRARVRRLRSNKSIAPSTSPSSHSVISKYYFKAILLLFVSSANLGLCVSSDVFSPNKPPGLSKRGGKDGRSSALPQRALCSTKERHITNISSERKVNATENRMVSGATSNSSHRKVPKCSIAGDSKEVRNSTNKFPKEKMVQHGNKDISMREGKEQQGSAPISRSTVSGKRRVGSTTRQTATLLRLRREWKDCVETGVGYDWQKQITIQRKLGMKSERNKERFEDETTSGYLRIGPLKSNLFNWHFSVRGPPSSPYESGIYHGRIVLPRDYPSSPPRVQLFTPNGRFHCRVDICLSASNYHPETWTPRWSIMALIQALRLHMLTEVGEIGGVLCSDEERRRLAELSSHWKWRTKTSGGGTLTVDHGLMVRSGVFSTSREKKGKALEVSDGGVSNMKEEQTFTRDNNRRGVGQGQGLDLKQAGTAVSQAVDKGETSPLNRPESKTKRSEFTGNRRTAAQLFTALHKDTATDRRILDRTHKMKREISYSMFAHMLRSPIFTLSILMVLFMFAYNLERL